MSSASERRARPWAPAAVTLLVLASALFRVRPLHDVVTGAEVPWAGLRLPASYVATAPFSDVFDALATLTLHQHFALFATALLAHVVFRVVRGKRRRTVVGRVAAEVGAFAVSLGILFVIYAATALAPRPMAALSLADPEMVAVDFHAHTEHSHDGRDGVTAERVRVWQRDGGYHAAYITDHRRFEGAAAGVAGNPRRAGDGTSLFSGIEVISERLHLNVLGATIADSAWFRERRVSPDSIGGFRPADGTETVVLLTIPGNLARVTPAMSLDAVEISDAAPKGLKDTQVYGGEIMRLADSLDLALVAATDNHGWGRTAVGWSVFRLPGWREGTPRELDLRIRRAVLEGRRKGASTTIERRRLVTAGAPLKLVATVPLAGWLMLRTLSWPERLSWIVWAWALWAVVALVRRRRGSSASL